MSQKSAAELVSYYVGDMRSNEAMLAKRFPWVEALIRHNIALSLNDGRETGVSLPPEPTNRNIQREGPYIAQDAGVRRLWQQHRIVYDIDPDLWAALSDTDPGVIVPGGLFSKLPHPDPFVALPDGIVLPIDDDTQMRITGFFVTGRTPNRAAQVSTHSPAACGDIGLLVAGDVEYTDGRPFLLENNVQDRVMTRVTLDVAHGQDTTIGALIAEIGIRFDRYRRSGKFEDTVPRMISSAVSALIYLCAENAELRPLPSGVAARRAKKAGGDKPAKVIQVGYISGPALRAYKRRIAAEDAQPGTGKKVRPHVRRSHFHTYRVGPGRLESTVKWLAPILINITGDAVKPTVISVRG